MSLQLVNDLSNEIEAIVDVDGNLWFKRTHVGKFLGLGDIRTSLNGLEKCEILTRRELIPTYATGWSVAKDQQNKTDIFRSKRGILYVINKCRKPTHNLKILDGLAGVELHKNKWLWKEQDALRQIMQAFNSEEMIHQFGAGKYKIDLYFIKYQLAIECDEFDHRDRDIWYEVERQKHIEKLLNCPFVRFNPDAKDFCILEVANKVLVQIKSFFKKKL